MSRLASFKGPSTPSSSPARAPGPASASPSRPSEPTYHRKVRNLLNDFRIAALDWDGLLSDGQRTLENLINTRTELENELTIIKMALPPTGLVTPRIQKMEKCLHDLNNIANSSQKLFDRMSLTADNLDRLLFEACQSKGSQWVQHEPLWTTWSLDHFAQRITSLVHIYHQTNSAMRKLITDIRPHDFSFSKSRQILAEWIARFQLTRSEWEEWDDICKLEIEPSGPVGNK